MNTNEEYTCTTVETNKPTVVYTDCTEITSCKSILDTLGFNYESKQWYKKILWKIEIFIYRFIVNPFKDFKYWCRDTIYLLKTKQQYQSTWSIDEALLDVLFHNIPILKKNKHTLSWKMLDKAILEANKDKKDFDLKNFYDTHYAGFGKDIEDRSVELEHELFDELIEHIIAYRYYMDWCMYIDEDDEKMVEIDKRLRPTIPLIDDNPDKHDYKKLNKMIDKHWNCIWEIVKEYGREFSD